MALNAFYVLADTTYYLGGKSKHSGTLPRLSVAMVGGANHYPMLSILQELLSGKTTPTKVGDQIAIMATDMLERGFLYSTDCLFEEAKLLNDFKRDEKLIEKIKKMLTELSASYASNIGQIATLDPKTQEFINYNILIPNSNKTKETPVSLQGLVYKQMCDRIPDIVAQYEKRLQ